MNKKELHDFIKEKQPNICQISCYKDGKEVYSDEWNNYKKIDTCHVMSATKFGPENLLLKTISVLMRRSVIAKMCCLVFVPPLVPKLGK